MSVKDKSQNPNYTTTEALYELREQRGATLAAQLLGCSVPSLNRWCADDRGPITAERLAHRILEDRKAEKEAKDGKKSLIVARVELGQQLDMLKAFMKGLDIKFMHFVD